MFNSSEEFTISWRPDACSSEDALTSSDVAAASSDTVETWSKSNVTFSLSFIVSFNDKLNSSTFFCKNSIDDFIL